MIDIGRGDVDAGDAVDEVDESCHLFGGDVDHVREGTHDGVVDAEHDEHGEEGSQAAAHRRDALALVELLDFLILLGFVVGVLLADLFLFCLHAGVGSHALLLFDRGREEDDLEN